MQRALKVVEEFDDSTAAYLKNRMQEGCYIPQEAIVVSLLKLSE